MSDEVPDVRALDIPSILREVGQPRISILKVDIEGAEAVLFGQGHSEWLSLVDNVAIEIHDDSCFGPATSTVLSALASEAFQVYSSGELTIATRANA